MSIRRIDAHVIFAYDVEKTAKFYKALGLDLIAEQHDGGELHFACEVHGAHIAVYQGVVPSSEQTPKHRQAGTAFVGFQVDDLLSVVEKLKSLRLFEVEVPIQSVPWGKRVIILDPDGRRVELNQANPTG